MMMGGGNDGDSDFVVGEAANLEPLRASIATGSADTIQMALDQLLDGTKSERILVPHTSATVSLHVEPKDDDGDNGSDMREGFQRVQGHVVITSERVLFVANNTAARDTNINSPQPAATAATFDLDIYAECIQLHAQSENPVSIYLQLDNNSDEWRPWEVTIEPSAGGEQQCQSIFDKLSELISLHPISPHGDNEGAAGMMGMMGMMMDGGTISDVMISSNCSGDNHDGNNDEDDDDELMVASPAFASGDPHQFSDVEEEDDMDAVEEEPRNTKQPAYSDNESDPGAPPQARAAMLERLDNLLVVKPELEIKSSDGDDDQFQDADNDMNQPVDRVADVDGNDKDSPINRFKANAKGQFDDATDDDDEIDPIL